MIKKKLVVIIIINVHHLHCIASSQIICSSSVWTGNAAVSWSTVCHVIDVGLWHRPAFRQSRHMIERLHHKVVSCCRCILFRHLVSTRKPVTCVHIVASVGVRLSPVDISIGIVETRTVDDVAHWSEIESQSAIYRWSALHHSSLVSFPKPSSSSALYHVCCDYYLSSPSINPTACIISLICYGIFNTPYTINSFRHHLQPHSNSTLPEHPRSLFSIPRRLSSTILVLHR